MSQENIKKAPSSKRKCILISAFVILVIISSITGYSIISTGIAKKNKLSDSDAAKSRLTSSSEEAKEKVSDDDGNGDRNVQKISGSSKEFDDKEEKPKKLARQRPFRRNPFKKSPSSNTATFIHNSAIKKNL